jgi:uncharacterized protein (DUF924 family)
VNRAAPSGEPTWVAEVLEFWFSELTPADWWKGSDEIDARIRAQFLDLHAQLLAAGGGHPDGARPTLATVIVLDQFSRNMFRGTPRAFAADPLARRIAREAINHGLDASLREEERMFLYLPFEHSEHRDDQALSVRLFSQLAREEWRHHAFAHYSIIERFGRFPRRNAVLGRQSTPEELAALEDPTNSY